MTHYTFFLSGEVWGPNEAEMKREGRHNAGRNPVTPRSKQGSFWQPRDPNFCVHGTPIRGDWCGEERVSEATRTDKRTEGPKSEIEIESSSPPPSPPQPENSSKTVSVLDYDGGDGGWLNW